MGDSTDGAGLLAALDRRRGVEPSGSALRGHRSGGRRRAAVAALADAGRQRWSWSTGPRARAEAAAALAGPAGGVGEPVVDRRGRDRGPRDPRRDGRQCQLTTGDPRADCARSPRRAGRDGPRLRADGHPVLRAAAERGAVTVGGIGMLVHQAALAIEHWTG